MIQPFSLSDFTSRLLAQDVLHAAMMGRSPRDVPFLRPEQFPIDRDREVWRVIIEMDRDGLPIDTIPLAERLKRSSVLEDDVNWDEYVIKLAATSTASSLVCFEENALTLYDNWWRWKKINELQDPTIPLEPDENGIALGVKPVTVHRGPEAFEPLPPINPLVDPWLAPGTVAMFYGDPATKKTYSMYSLAVSLARGVEWLHFQCRKSRVLIVDEESGERRMHQRIQECARGVLADPSIDISWVTLHGFKLTDLRSQRELEALVAREKPDVIFMDSLARLRIRTRLTAFAKRQRPLRRMDRFGVPRGEVAEVTVPTIRRVLLRKINKKWSPEPVLFTYCTLLREYSK